MPDLYKSKIPVIYRSLNEGYIRGAPDEPPAFGAVPRDYDADPPTVGAAPSEMQLVPESEYDARYDEAEATESSLEHLFLRGGKPAFAFLDQGRFPDCWAHSTAHCQMLDRLKQNLPVVRLNAVAVATMLNRTNGGWSGLSLRFSAENGYPVMGTGPGEWPEWTRDRKYDTPELRAAMKRHRADETWYDLGRREYSQTLTARQLDTCGFSNVPCGTDWNRFGHAMCTIAKVRIERGHWGYLTLNSHQGFGYFGLCVLAGMVPDNAVGLRSSTPSAA